MLKLLKLCMIMLNLQQLCNFILVAFLSPCNNQFLCIYFATVCPNATGGSSTIHTVTAIVTALGLTGVAMLFF